VHHFFCWVFVIAIHATHFQDAKTALEINPAEQAVRATALEQVQLKAAATREEYKRKQIAETEALKQSEIGKFLKKRTEDNAEKNEASIREKYCVRNCKFQKALNREPSSSREFLCEECRQEFGVIPGADKFLKTQDKIEDTSAVDTQN